MPSSALTPRLRVRQVSASNHHTAVVSEGGDVLTWGHNQKGQLGHGDRIDRETPTLVEWVRQMRGGEQQQPQEQQHAHHGEQSTPFWPVQVSCGADYEGEWMEEYTTGRRKRASEWAGASM